MWSKKDIALLYQQHSYAVFQRCRRLLGDEVEARDMMQQVFLRCMENAQPFRGGAKAATYLFTVATNLCLNQIRNHRARNDHWLEAAATRLKQSLHHDDAALQVSARQLLAAIFAQSDELTAKIAVWHHVDGLTQDETAKLAGVSRVTVNQRLQRLHKVAREGAVHP